MPFFPCSQLGISFPGYLYPGLILLDFNLDCNDPFIKDLCGTCTKCIDECPTDAIFEEYNLPIVEKKTPFLRKVCESHDTVFLKPTGGVSVEMIRHQGVLNGQQQASYHVLLGTSKDPFNSTKTDDIGVVYIGDGALEEGVVHESFNLAKIQKAPMLFVIENNLFASHMHISSRQPSDMTSRFAIANNIPHKLVDGNDVVAVSKASKELIDDMRAGKGPALIELVTYRWYGHVDWRVDVDVGVERSLDDIENWKKRDPILRLSKSMIKAKIWTMEQEKILNNKIDKEIQIAWEKAMNDSYPSSDATLKYVYSQENNEK